MYLCFKDTNKQKGSEKMNIARMTLRLPHELSDKLSFIAQKMGISRNSLIVSMAWDLVEKRKEKETCTNYRKETVGSSLNQEM